jgi:hypothetical protein
MNKLIIYGVNNNNNLKFDVIISDPPEYFDFNNIFNIIQQYDFIVILDDVIHNKKNIIESLNFLIEINYDQIILDNAPNFSLEIMEYDYYNQIIKSNRIFKNIIIEDLKHKNIPNYKPFQYIFSPSIIRTKNFLLPNFFLKKNPHIENLYWRELLGGNCSSPLTLSNRLRFDTPPCSCFKIGKIHEIKWGDEKRREVPSIDNNITNEIVSGDEDRTSVPPAVPPAVPSIDNNITHEIAWGGKGGMRYPPPLTIVTGYLNIKIKRPAKSNTENQTYDYIDKSRGTLQIPQFMVIYCSEDIIEDVSKIRDEYGLLDKTKIIKITLEKDLYMIDKLEKIRENVSKNNPPYNIPEYILAVNSRYGYIQNAIENNYFQTDYFAWIDFSASHIVDIPPNKIIEPKSHDKVRIGWIARYTDNQIVYNHYFLGGGIFAGHKEIMKELIKIHHIEFVKLTEMGYNINDDRLLYIIMEQNPYLFDTYFSYYNNLFIRL